MLGKLVLFWCFANTFAYVRLTDKEYSLMPPVFSMDDYDRCMDNKEESLFCAVTYQLAPLRNESVPEVWTIIEKIRNDRTYYRHDLLRHQICVRHFCPNALFKNGEELKITINQCFDETYKKFGLKGTVINLNCVTAETINYPLKTSDIVVATVGILYILLVLYASIYEGSARYLSEEEYNKRTSTGFGWFLSLFSIPKNYYRLTSKERNPDIERLKGLNGIRFFSMYLIILAHVGLLSLSGAVINPKATEDMTRSISSVIFMNGTLIVHTFFAVSAFLLTYHFYQVIEKYDKVQPKILLLAVVNRYIRLAPSLLVALLFTATWIEHLIDGPVWHFIMKTLLAEKCRTNWWPNILFINNLINTDRMCMSHTWYLAVDMQLFLVTILILGLVWKYRNLEKLIFGLCFIAGVLMPAYVAYTQKLEMILTQYPEDLYSFNSINSKVFNNIYTATHANFGGWMVGMIFGYFYYYRKDVPLFTKKIYVVFWWILFLSCLIIPTITGGIMYLENYEYNPLHSALNWSLTRPSWALGAVILIFGISQGIGWWTKWIFELDSLRVLGRLTYGAYILHPLFTGYRVGVARTPAYSANSLFAFMVFGDICMSYLGSFILCLLVEMPVSALQKAFLQKKLKEKPLVYVNGNGKKVE